MVDTREPMTGFARIRAADAAVADLSRIRDGGLVEHWDALQPVPATPASTHPMF